MKITPPSQVNLKPEKLILEKSFVSIYYNATENWLYIQWKGDQTEETLLRGSEHMLTCVKSTGSTKIINDSSNFTKTWPNLVNWWANVYSYRLQEAGIHFFAWIYGDQNIIKPTADAILQKEKSEILVMVFDNLKTAEIWLRSVR